VPRSGALEVGETYFAVFYHDERCNTPEIDTLIYLGRDLNGTQPGNEVVHYFQLAYSYYRHGNWNNLSTAERELLSDYPLQLYGVDSLDPICDLAGLLTELSELLQKQNGKPAP
jgi:hypothetical protein